MRLTDVEFQKRCEEVFDIYDDEECYGMDVDQLVGEEEDDIELTDYHS